jgi:hypothetical protein
MNAGLLIARSSQRTVDALNAIRASWDERKKKKLEYMPHKQKTMKDYFEKHPTTAARTRYLPQSTINMFP